MGLFDDSIGPFVLGTVLASFLTGVTTAQAFQYYQNFGTRDRPLYRYLVFGLILLVLTHTSISIYTIFDWCVANYGNVEHLVRSPWSFAVDPAFVGIVAFACQAFYSYRVYVVGGRKWPLTIAILVLSSVSLGFAIASTAQIFHLKEFTRFQSFTWGVSCWLSLSAASDVVITASLVYFLSKSKNTGMKSTNSVINKLIELIVGTNLLTCAVAIIDAVLFGSMNNSWHVFPNLLLPASYVGSLIVSLNARVALERKLLQSSGHGESHDLANISRVGPRTGHAKLGFLNQHRATERGEGGMQGIHVTTHRSIIADGELNSSTYLPSSETTSDKELPFYSTDKEVEARRDISRTSPFVLEGNQSRLERGSV